MDTTETANADAARDTADLARFGRARQVGDDEADARDKLARIATRLWRSPGAAWSSFPLDR